MSRSLGSVGVAALLLTLLVPATSFAAPRHSTACDLIRDPQGDTTEPTPDNKQQLELVSGDIAATSHQLTAVIRLAALTGADATQPAGRIYEFDFSVGS